MSHGAQVTDFEDYMVRAQALFDQRRVLPYGSLEGMSAAAKKILYPAWTSGDPDKIVQATEEFMTEFRKTHPSTYLRGGIKIADLLGWLFETEHIRLNYGLRYNGIELEKLSPGTKGIVLLILYLGLDTNDRRPLIVDQPDENLDNESIFRLLTAYFREAKRRRQVILITHNPNLVVNTDSDQVIVADIARQESGLPAIKYRSGSLENCLPIETGVRQTVCRILEGGADAFKRRERRYSLNR